jgi:predicted metal-binding membrane protein
MSTTNGAQRFPRGRFILFHLGAVVLTATAGVFTGIAPLTLIVALTPLLGMRKAGRDDRRTLALSTALAVLLVACGYALLLLMFVTGLGKGRV